MQSRPHATDEQRRLLDSLRWDLRFQLCGDYEYSTKTRFNLRTADESSDALGISGFD